MKNKFLHSLIKYIFTIDKNTIENCRVKKNKRKQQILYRIAIFILILPLLWVCFFSYFQDGGFTIFNIFRTILFLFIIRILAKKMIDHLIVLFFHKSSYELSSQEIRRLKLKKIKRKSGKFIFR